MIVNRPFPVVTQDAKFAKKTLLKAGNKLLSKYVATPSREKSSIAARRKAFGFVVHPTKTKTLLGVPCALSEAGG